MLEDGLQMYPFGQRSEGDDLILEKDTGRCDFNLLYSTFHVTV